ncbi:MAG: aspartate aminotransferase family protein [Thiotrichales bacterium]|jgi:acetylornithine aminotransferase|nr:aspartate aminotransferase family protein [Thiotrichales bacterium]MBT3613387.1 aspartate aminotransferase family protein [Thiotrichales bacterium]MBT3752486.1 aspartate aminotransferase family protein [Thiotrichales bacterium]MBT3837445.1 aspartate aminotransferase family protein [Thiotrichales bacterium]MBT4151428.1 aspartate aminotransferase family protein [Thiotrichales bacterium]
MPTYGRLPLSFVKGEGAWLWSDDGEKYLDALSGIAVCGLGHSHPAVTATICEQAGTLLHTSNLYGIPKQQELADKLCKISGMENMFFSNSGAEANEAAIKLARLHGHNKGIDSPSIIVAKHSFHGRTLATLSATGSRKVQAGFEPLVSGFIRAPYDDIDALKDIAANSKNIAAIMVEPVQGEGGVRIPSADYLSEVRELCDREGWLMILDEVQTGMGRTGKWFGFQHSTIKPDVMTLAKALGNGVPIGACLAQGEAATLFKPGMHGSTFGGNPLVCSVALTVIKTIEEDNLLQRAEELGEYIHKGLAELLQDNSTVLSIRNRGLMVGIELDRPCSELVQIALNNKLLINVTADSVVRLLPPLILSDEEAQQIIETVAKIINEFTTK